MGKSNFGMYLLAALLIAGALGGIAFGIVKSVQYRRGIEVKIKAEEQAMNAKAEASPGKLLAILQKRHVEQLVIAPLEQYPKRGLFSVGLTEKGAADLRQYVLSLFQPVMSKAGIPCFYSESRPQAQATTAILTFTVAMLSGKLHGRDGRFIEFHFEARIENTSEVIWIDSWKFWKGQGE